MGHSDLSAIRMYWEEHWRVISGSALVFCLALAFVSYQATNVPVDSGTTTTGQVLEVGVSHGSRLEVAHPLASVRQESGVVAYVEVPTQFVVSKGQYIYIQRSNQEHSGTQYVMRGLVNDQ